jgi:hypothetical protein
MNMLYNQRHIELTDTPPPADDEVNAVLKGRGGTGQGPEIRRIMGPGKLAFCPGIGGVFPLESCAGNLACCFFSSTSMRKSATRLMGGGFVLLMLGLRPWSAAEPDEMLRPASPAWAAASTRNSGTGTGTSGQRPRPCPQPVAMHDQPVFF